MPETTLDQQIASIDSRIERVLVTGAAGFIAQSVVTRLRTVGLTPVTLDRVVPSDDGRCQIDQHVDLIDADLEPILAEVDAVIHLAGTPGVQSSWADGFDLHVRNNLVATQRLCEAALRTSCRRLVIASSSSVYGSVDDGLVHESRPPAPLSPYGASKAATEHLVTAYASRGLEVTPLRYFTVYGPWQRPDMAIHRMFRAALGGPAFPLRGDGTHARSFTAVEDVAVATVEAVRRTTPSAMPINVGGTDVVSVRALLDRIERLTGTTVPIEHLPAAPGDPARTAADVGRAAALLGWRPNTSIDEGLQHQWAWHRLRIGGDAPVGQRGPATAEASASSSGALLRG